MSTGRESDPAPAQPRHGMPAHETSAALGRAEGDATMNEQQRNDPTLHLPAGDPTAAYRVEPDRPVPDDVVHPGPDPEPTRQLPTFGRSPAGGPSAQPERAPVTVAKGPRPGTVFFGLLALIVSAYVVLENVTTATFDWVRTGPVFVGGVGVLLLVVGITGVIFGRSRR